ncbi:MAG: NAD(P)/FAD-dependent oxidoreductase, partial [Bacteroidia bacterium]
MKTVNIIGGGPAALMLAAQLDSSKYNITLYEQKKTLGRKFLVAGEGGLNLTFDSDQKKLESQYQPSEYMSPFLRRFNNTNLREWLKAIEIGTFSGSSNRVFPIKGIKPITVLNAIIGQLEENRVNIQLDSKWTGWDKDGNLAFEDESVVDSDITVFALGGASWQVTGSDGHWAKLFADKKIHIKSFRAANCAFNVNWDEAFLAHHVGKPLKNIEIELDGFVTKGEI